VGNVRIVLYLQCFVADIFADSICNYLSTKGLVQRAVWQDSGISPAETAVRIWKLLPRRNVSEAATSPSRWDVVGYGGSEFYKEKVPQNDNFS